MTSCKVAIIAFVLFLGACTGGPGTVPTDESPSSGSDTDSEPSDEDEFVRASAPWLARHVDANGPGTASGPVPDPWRNAEGPVPDPWRPPDPRDNKP